MSMQEEQRDMKVGRDVPWACDWVQALRKQLITWVKTETSVKRGRAYRGFIYDYPGDLAHKVMVGGLTDCATVT